MKKLPPHLLTTVTYKPNSRFYRGVMLGIAISCLIVCAAAGILLFGDLILDFWRL